ncbi:ATP12 family chaperone protein [Ferrovibrio sp.]|uniref:ATP12 family chaperone protein n=1 Tax=Ferrovibrio sp. TaxID=1917215 RepID=UPI001B6559D4|nr:ATP12 family protein [Ferrovibrio sp.]MBP7064222.1 ATPase [Ferrovibrio sp.]
MKRFYKTATAQASADGGAVVLLDGRVLKTPAKQDMRLPTLALAEAIAAEWAAQGAEIRPQDMPLMQLAATALDRLALDRSPAVADVVRYSGSDLLAYRAEFPPELVLRQQAEWQPLLDWFRERYDVAMNVTQSITAVPQPPELAERIRRVCETIDPLRLTALQTATNVCGSVVIALALLEGRVDAMGAFRIGYLDELHQAERWGEDEEAVARRQALQAELAAIERFISLL